MPSKVVNIGVLGICLLEFAFSSQHCKLGFCGSGPIPIEDYIRQHGYPVEAHQITTADGYILTYHRIPHGKSPGDSAGRRPVLLQHGLLSSSAVWAIMTDSLGYSLADAGFDVWLGNARGNTYSRRHERYNPDTDKRAFWDFSWHEMGYYDLPASIDYILNVTGQEQLFYIGHSMGTTMYFVLGATRPEYMDKVQAAIALAPVAYPWNIRSPIANFANYFSNYLERLLKAINMYEIFPYSEGTYWLDEAVCSRHYLQFICRAFIFEISGFDSKELNMTSFPTVLNYLPAGASYKQLQHYSQICRSGTNFPQFNYGPIRNMWKYGSATPPSYNLTYAKAPLYIYYGLNDWLAVPQDVFYTVNQLPNVQGVRKVPDDQFNHLDFMWAIDAKSLVYDDIIDTLQDITQS